MNAKQRRKQEKRQGLVKLGRMATVEIAAAQADRAAALAMVSAKDQALLDGMHASATLAEAKQFAEAAMEFDRRANAKAMDEQARLHAEAMEAQRQRYAAELSTADEKVKQVERKLDTMRSLIAEPAKLRKRLQGKQNENDRLTRELNLALQKPTTEKPLIILSAQAVKMIEADRKAQAMAAAGYNPAMTFDRGDT